MTVPWLRIRPESDGLFVIFSTRSGRYVVVNDAARKIVEELMDDAARSSSLSINNVSDFARSVVDIVPALELLAEGAPTTGDDAPKAWTFEDRGLPGERCGTFGMPL